MVLYQWYDSTTIAAMSVKHFNKSSNNGHYLVAISYAVTHQKLGMESQLMSA